jgi:Zn ribbon nucleic-acid-binding protein
MLPDDLPRDLPTFIARFGTDEQCRDYLFRQRWPEGFRCRACGHGEAWALARRHIYECVACGQQHSLLKGTIFEQTKTGLAKWFLAIYLVTTSKGGISAMELQRRWASAATRRPGPGCTRSARRWSVLAASL